MFSNHEQLKRRTPKDGIDRREFITLLVDEYYETPSLAAQQQVTANLANFAYDPINWGYLRQAKAHDLFIEILNNSVDPALLIHAAAGVCNFCLDEQIGEYLRRGGTVKQLRTLIEKYPNSGELLGHLLTTLIYLDKQPIDQAFRRLMLSLQRGTNKIVANLATVYLEDNGAASNKKVPESSFSTGQVLTLSRVFCQADLVKFAEFTGDRNPIHQLNQQSFVNGALLNATTAGIIGSNFPGYVVTSQEFRFPNRCRLDEEVLFRVKVEEMRKIVGISYECTQGEQTVFVGTAKLFAVRS
ncbi:LOW QUALITY PROTEIN: uncharacterized protein LOC135705430 [Ochlerotatus camptorhynchus]|uniref:LOW QUALITY PROTEIN: uncharacterized protein LOC135705430 n=1 Tax=Ochlerotatus camptorhynchus TaxID=644619 RepID=UPI0031E23E34